MSIAIKSSGSAPTVSSLRLLATLGGAGALAGFLIVSAYTATLPGIEANRAATLDLAIREVLPRVERYDTLYLHEGALSTEAPQGDRAHKPDTLSAGFDANGALVGFAAAVHEPGVQEPIEILFGFDPRTKSSLGLAILMSRETPGLGDKIQDERWREQFGGRMLPLTGIKTGGTETDATIHMVTGATISSRAVIGAVNKGVEHWMPLVTRYLQGGRP